jgi:hypothetical protein
MIISVAMIEGRYLTCFNSRLGCNVIECQSWWWTDAAPVALQNTGVMFIHGVDPLEIEHRHWCRDSRDGRKALLITSCHRRTKLESCITLRLHDIFTSSGVASPSMWASHIIRRNLLYVIVVIAATQVHIIIVSSESSRSWKGGTNTPSHRTG